MAIGPSWARLTCLACVAPAAAARPPQVFLLFFTLGSNGIFPPLGVALFTTLQETLPKAERQKR